MGCGELTIGGVTVPPGSRTTIALPVGRLHTYTPMTMPVHVIHGKRPGPRLFVCAAIHGDELNGVEIVRRLLKLRSIDNLKGALVAIPIVNVYGVISHSRYLPDRRDLNRLFPGSDSGSLTARQAHLFDNEILAHCTHGIDLHTGALHRNNLPHVRADLDDPETEGMARAFGAPVMVNANLRDGSLRETAKERGIPMLVYEAGEALRFNEVCIRAGTRGIVEVMRNIGMLPPSRRHRKAHSPVQARSSTWVRAEVGGIFRTVAPLGKQVEAGDLLGVVANPFGTRETNVTAPASGVVIARLNLPLVNEGDALYHIARFRQADDAASRVEEFQTTYQEEFPELEPPIGGETPTL